MKLMHVIWGFAGGGVDKVVAAYARMAANERLKQEFVCLHGEGWGTDLDGLAAIGATRIEFRNRRDLSWIGRLGKHIDHSAPELIFAHGFNAPIAVAMSRHKGRHKPPLACSYHGRYHAPRLSRKPLEPVFNGMLHWLYRNRAAGVIAVAEHSREFLISRGVDPKIVTTINNGLPDHPGSAKPPRRTELGLNQSDFVIGAASRLAPEKGLLYLLYAMPAICAKVPRARLLILGHGPQEHELKALTRELGLQEKVVFAGFRPDAEIFLSLYDVFALPSLAEYHSIALLEAMRAERPIVATTVGGNSESVRDKKEALMVPPADPSALAQAIIQIALEPALANQLAKNARARFEAEFSEAVMLRRTCAWLNTIGANS